MNIFSNLGIHGWDKIESHIIASIMLGEPFALISEPGTGKTYLGKIIGEALDLEFGYYDVSKAEFADIAGFPSPEAYKEGRIETIPTPLTIEDKEVVVVDELSRINRTMSNSWLEILGSRMLMGKKLPLKVIMGAMNPISHQGTKPLDEAFADRFIAFIPTPRLQDMDVKTRKTIIAAETGLDAPSAKFWSGEQSEDYRATYVVDSPKFQEAAKVLRDTIKSSAKDYMEFSNSARSQRIIDYLDLFSTSLAKEAEIVLEGRRLKMMKRFIEATLITRANINGTNINDLEENEMINLVGTCVAYSLPHQVTGQENLSAHALDAAHTQAASALKGDDSDYLLYNAATLADKFALILQNKYDPAVVQKIVAELEGDDSMEANILALSLTSLMREEAFLDYIPIDLLQTLITRVGKINFSTTATMNYNATTDFEAVKEVEDEFNEIKKEAETSPVKNALLSIIYSEFTQNNRRAYGQQPDKDTPETLGELISKYYTAVTILEEVKETLSPVKKSLQEEAISA